MGGERGLMKSNSHIHKKGKKDVPKGCLAIKVGEDQQRFVVPVVYFNHPLFMRLLKEAEDEYGFDHKGTITIPCHVDEFQHVQEMINRDKSRHHHLHLHHHNHHLAIAACFRA